jgi:hypothetical protein
MEPGNDPTEHGQKLAGMISDEPLEPNFLSEELETSSGDSGHKFKIAVVYQDKVTQSWAMQLCDPVEEKFGGEYVQNTWHDVNSLSDPEMLLEAVRAALSADVIVISVYAADELPPELYAWINVWLPRRLSRAGALAALIGVAGKPAPHAVRTQEYFQAVARRGQLDFLPHERKLSDEPRDFSTEPNV